MPKSKGRRKPKRTHQAPPPPKEVKVSPPWYIATMFSLMALGVIIIVVNYIDLMPADLPWLYIGLGSIAVGFVMTLNFH